MRKYIIITSIFEPTEAVKKFSKLEDFNVIVVGDKKSPKNWECKNVEYLSIDKQEKSDFSLYSPVLKDPARPIKSTELGQHAFDFFIIVLTMYSLRDIRS